MIFDLEKGSTLYIDLAKSNSRAKRARIGVCFDLFVSLLLPILDRIAFEL